uniref:Uncharacterized protein n=1 Tax=blood disease bacterium R229 TaxID=741978 RepID=G2ZXL1_9RALS|nr:conserved hypothetical protein [blood disease bacterium R229]
MRPCQFPQRTRRARMNPLQVMVLVPNVDWPTMYTVVVEAMLTREIGAIMLWPLPVVSVAYKDARPLCAGSVPDVVLTPALIEEIVVEPAGLKNTVPETSQSPAVSDMDVQLADVLEVREVPEVELLAYSPQLPDTALSLVDVPTMPEVLDGVIKLVACTVVKRPVDAVVAPTLVPLIVPPLMVAVLVEIALSVAVLVVLSVVNAPLPGVVLPIAPGAANVALPSVDALIAVLQLNPLALVHRRALELVLQLGTGTAAGDALEPVAFPSSEFAAMGESEPAPMLPQYGAVLGPVETIACPEADPAGFKSWIGVLVCALQTIESAASVRIRNFFMCLYPREREQLEAERISRNVRAECVDRHAVGREVRVRPRHLPIAKSNRDHRRSAERAREHHVVDTCTYSRDG